VSINEDSVSMVTTTGESTLLDRNAYAKDEIDLIEKFAAKVRTHHHETLEGSPYLVVRTSNGNATIRSGTKFVTVKLTFFDPCDNKPVMDAEKLASSNINPLKIAGQVADGHIYGNPELSEHLEYADLKATDRYSIVYHDEKHFSVSHPSLPNKLARIFLDADTMTFVYLDGKVRMKPINCLDLSEWHTKKILTAALLLFKHRYLELELSAKTIEADSKRTEALEPLDPGDPELDEIFELIKANLAKLDEVNQEIIDTSQMGTKTAKRRRTN